MDIYEHETLWIKRVEELIKVLEGSTIGELELTEAGTEIIIKRRPHIQKLSLANSGLQVVPGAAGWAEKEDSSVVILAPLAGVYYIAASPASPPFVNPGDVVHVGQVVAIVEAMKVFNEIQSEVAGRVVELVATNGNVVQKGDVLMRVEPL